ncbi:CAP domain-containing protein [Actinophytocola sp.]|uniref:CAP domain-containing protein n=1 Tax=Actinophytocola sp. TaxID=1872138 RepID=UPI002D7F472A|nr:CAP domain-containing protein [Actinophytocola sp.]HET9142862.1 CAP domain-containing protein [Actinophytocola sp.]
MTTRRTPSRPVLPVLVAVFLGASTAGTATLMVQPGETSQKAQAALAASFVKANRPQGRPGQPQAARPAPAAPGPAAPDARPAEVTKTETATPVPTTTVTVTPPATTTPEATTVPGDPAKQAEKVVELVNVARAENGCAPVTVDARLTAAALAHSTDMAARDYFLHTTPEGVTFDQRIREAGYLSPGAENIARGQQNAAQVMKDWMNSPGHKANILNCELTAIGVALVSDGFYWTQDFGR